MSNNIQESKMKASEIPIDFVVPEGALGMFVSNVVVQHTKEEFTLSFFQIQHPADPGGETPEKVRALLVGGAPPQRGKRRPPAPGSEALRRD